MSKSIGRCSHCAEEMELQDDGLLPYHDWPKLCRQICHGAKKLPSDDRETLKAENRAVRMYLWLGHGHQGLYGDDGEMQCNMHHPGADFKREPMQHLIDHCIAAAKEPK